MACPISCAATCHTIVPTVLMQPAFAGSASTCAAQKSSQGVIDLPVALKTMILPDVQGVNTPDSEAVMENMQRMHCPKGCHFCNSTTFCS